MTKDNDLVVLPTRDLNFKLYCPICKKVHVLTLKVAKFFCDDTKNRMLKKGCPSHEINRACEFDCDIYNNDDYFRYASHSQYLWVIRKLCEYNEVRVQADDSKSKTFLFIAEDFKKAFGIDSEIKHNVKSKLIKNNDDIWVNELTLKKPIGKVWL